VEVSRAVVLRVRHADPFGMTNKGLLGVAVAALLAGGGVAALGLVEEGAQDAEQSHDERDDEESDGGHAPEGGVAGGAGLGGDVGEGQDDGDDREGR